MKFLIILFTPLMIFAHSLSVTASYESGEFFVESYYGNGDACKGCSFVIDHQGSEIFKGHLDDEGLFEEKVKLQTPFTVHIDGGMGHQAKVNIEGTEFKEKEPQTINTPTTTPVSMIDEEKIKKIIRSELKKQNVKIEGMIEKHRSKTEQVLVGLGYILGIFGLWQLFARRYQK